MFCQQGLSSLGGLIGGRRIFQRRAHSCVHGDVVILTLGQVLECFQLRFVYLLCPIFVILRLVQRLYQLLALSCQALYEVVQRVWSSFLWVRLFIFFYMRMCVICGESYKSQKNFRELATPKMVWDFLTSEATRRTSLSHGHRILKI